MVDRFECAPNVQMLATGRAQGDWVRHSDYAALRAELEAVRAILTDWNFGPLQDRDALARIHAFVGDNIQNGEARMSVADEFGRDAAYERGYDAAEGVYRVKLASLRAELEAVKREAVEVVRPFAEDPALDDRVSDDAIIDLDETNITVGLLRAARTFTEKHGNG